MVKETNNYINFVKPRLKEVTELKSKGATDEEIASKLGVSPRSFRRYKKDYPDLREAIKEGKIGIKGNVYSSVYKSAIGFTGPDGKFYPPNMKAAEITLLRLEEGINYDLKKGDSDNKKQSNKLIKKLYKTNVEKAEEELRKLKLENDNKELINEALKNAGPENLPGIIFNLGGE